MNSQTYSIPTSTSELTESQFIQYFMRPKYSNFEIIHPISFDYVRFHMRESIFSKFVNEIVSIIHTITQKIRKMDILDTNGNEAFINPYKFTLTQNHENYKLMELNSIVVEYLHYVNILLALKSIYKIKCSDNWEENNILQNFFSLFCIKRTSNHWFAKTRESNKIGFHDFLKNKMLYFYRFVILFVIKKYLAINYNFYGEGARFIAELIFNYAIDCREEMVAVGNVILNERRRKFDLLDIHYDP